MIEEIDQRIMALARFGPGARVQNMVSKTIAIVTHNLNPRVPWVRVRYQRRDGQVVKTAWWVENVQVYK